MASILSAPGDGRRGERLLLAALAVAWLLFALPLILGDRTLIQRDVFTTHLHMKAFGAEALARGSIPAFNPVWALGQPFAGNPNALPYYPGNLLYLVLPFWSAFNAHYVLHWLLAFVAFRALARELDQSPLGATLSALTYAGSGYVLSCLTFYNLIAVVAWLPLVLWGLGRGGRRGLLWGGIACGLMLLSGEPITAALALAPMALVAVDRHGARRGLLSTLAVGAIGVGIALPQVVAAARTFGFTYRGAHGLLSVQAANHALHPLRLLELLLPLPWGFPTELGRFGYWSSVTPIMPYIYSLHFGVLGLALGLFVLRRRWTWAAMAIAGLAFGYLGGLSGETVLALTGGLFRYPQKLLLWTTVGGALLAGWGLDRLLAPGGVRQEESAEESAARRRRAVRLLALGAFGALATALFLLVLRSSVRTLFMERLDARHEWVAATHQTLWFFGFALVALTLALAAWALRRRNGVALVAVAALALLQLSPMLTTDEVARLAPPAPWVAELGSNRAVMLVANAFPPWSKTVPMVGVETVVEGTRDVRLDLDPGSAALYGVTYPLASDLDGIYSPLHALLLQNLAQFDWPARIGWMRLLGVGWLVRQDDGLAPPPLERVAAEKRLRLQSELYRIPDPAPIAFWPREVVSANSPVDALAWTTRIRDPLAVAVSRSPVDHHPGGVVKQIGAEDDRLRLAVESDGGLLVVQRSYFPILEARLENGEKLATQPVDLVLLGIEVPAGRHEIQIGASSRPEAIAGVLSLLLFTVAVLVGWFRP